MANCVRQGPVSSNPSKRLMKLTHTQAILAMCDVQILTGIGILVSGYADLKCGISAYHFLLIGSVAWFSNLTHTAGLTVLRQYLHQRLLEKWVRLSFMIALALMLLTAMGPAVFFNWTASTQADDGGSAGLPGSYAICFFDTRLAIEWHYAVTNKRVENSPNFQSVLMSMLLIVFSLGSRTIKLLSSLSGMATRVRKSCSDNNKARILRLYMIRSSRSGWRPRHKPEHVPLWIWRSTLFAQMTFFLLFRIYTDLLASSLSDVSSLFLLLLEKGKQVPRCKNQTGVQTNSAPGLLGNSISHLGYHQDLSRQEIGSCRRE